MSKIGVYIVQQQTDISKTAVEMIQQEASMSLFPAQAKFCLGLHPT